MARGKRKFVLEIRESVSVGELTAALSKTAGNISNGRLSLESGVVRTPAGRPVGTYRWELQELDSAG